MAQRLCGTWHGSTSPSSSCSTCHTPDIGKASGPGACSYAAVGLWLHRNSCHSWAPEKHTKHLCLLSNANANTMCVCVYLQNTITKPQRTWTTQNMTNWKCTYCEHWKARTSGLGWCLFKCLLKPDALWNDLPHVVHRYLDSPVTQWAICHSSFFFLFYCNNLLWSEKKRRKQSFFSPFFF